jgi:hypothetical protein
VFQVFIKNVYVSAIPGEVNNLGPIAAGCILITVILMIEVVHAIGLSAFSFDLETFG